MAVVFLPALTRATDFLGVAAPGSKLYFYLTQTLTLATVYTDATGITPLSNPVVADSKGVFPNVFVNKTTVLRVRFTDSTNALLRPDVDPVYVQDPDIANATTASLAAIMPYVTAAANSATAALTASATAGVYPTAAATNIPVGLTQASVGALTPGSGGANGTFALVFSAGNFSINPTGTFTVAGGVLTAVTITGPGLYIGASPTVPTVSFVNSAGLTGAAVALTALALVASGQGYWVVRAGNQYLDRYKNVTGTATVDAGVPAFFVGDQSNINTLATNIAAINTVSTNISSVNTVATNIASVIAATSVPNAIKLAAIIDTVSVVTQTGTDILASEKRSVGKDPYSFVFTSGYFQFPTGARILASWSAAHRGMQVPIAGQPAEVYEIEIPAGLSIGANNAILYIGIVTPTAPLPLSAGATLTTNNPRVIAQINFAAYGAQTLGKITWKGSPVSYNAGDLLVFWGPNVGFLYGTNTGATPPASTAYNGQFNIAVDITGTNTAAGLGTGFTTTSNDARQFPYVAKVAAGPVRAGLSGPSSYVTLDAFGLLGDGVGSPAAMPLAGKNGAIVGSSVSTPVGGGNPTDVGHFMSGLVKLGATATNYAVGGSYVCWAPTATGTAVENQTIGATAAELTARFGAGFAQYSYEQKLVGKGFDFIVLPDSINDTNLGAFTVGTFTGSYGDPSTLYGVYRRMIEAILAAEPAQRIFLQSPMHPWASYSGTGAPTEQVNRRQWRDAMLDLADKYSLAGVLDYIKSAGCSAPVVQSGQGLFDSIHPTQAVKATAGQRVVYETMRHG